MNSDSSGVLAKFETEMHGIVVISSAGKPEGQQAISNTIKWLNKSSYKECLKMYSNRQYCWHLVCSAGICNVRVNA